LRGWRGRDDFEKKKKRNEQVKEVDNFENGSFSS